MSAASTLYQPVSPLDLPSIDLAALLSGSGQGVCVEPPGTMREFTRASAHFHDDPDSAGLFRYGISPFSIRCPPGFAVGFDEIQLVGYRTVLTRDGRFFNDEPGTHPGAAQDWAAKIAGADGYSNEDTGLVRTEGGFVLERRERYIQRIDSPVVVLCSNEPSNYGSFLFRVLPKLAMFGAEIPDVPVLAYVPLPNYRELVELAGVAPGRVVAHNPGFITEIKRAILPGLRNDQAYLDDESLAFYAAMKARLGVAGGGGRRIYISRLGVTTHGRRMENEAELVDALAERGFDIIRPQDFTAREQIALFANARMVVGPSGAALFNCVFCEAGTVLVDIESEPYWIHAHASLFTSCGLQWGVFEGKTIDQDFSIIHKPYRVNIPALLARIDQLG
jgi:capsular polysaccharide biosynthesis protein